MKHIFIINPRAGKVDRVAEMTQQIESFAKEIEYEIYVTKSRGDAKDFVETYLKEHDPNKMYRFYAIGGDGTLNDVANGAYNYENAEVAVYASGSGNDFIKNFGNGPEFKDLASLIHGTSKKVDLIKVNDKVCVNICSLGFDAEVTLAMHKFKRWPLVSGKMAYSLAAVTSLLFKMVSQFKCEVDSEEVFDGKGVLTAVANGHTYGGGFRCAPEAKVDDGLLDLICVRRVSRFKAQTLLNLYKKGEHLTNPKFEKIVIYRHCKDVRLTSPKDIAYQIDGENYLTHDLHLQVMESKLNFVIPKKMHA